MPVVAVATPPGGGLIVADYQAELRATLLGAGGIGQIRPGSVKGLGVPPAKTGDVDVDHAAGAYGSEDYSGVRLVTFVIDIIETTEALAWSRLKDLHTTWAPAATDIPLYMRLPSWGKFFVNGRPRGLDEDTELAPEGTISALATFVALDPAITYVA